LIITPLIGNKKLQTLTTLRNFKTQKLENKKIKLVLAWAGDRHSRRLWKLVWIREAIWQLQWDLPLPQTSDKSWIVASKKCRNLYNLFIRKWIPMITWWADMFRRRWSLPYLFLLPTVVMDHHLSDMDWASITTHHLCGDRKLNVLKQTGSQDTKATTLCIEHTTFIYSAWCSPHKDAEERGSNTRPSYIQSDTLSTKINRRQHCGSIWAHLETIGRDCYFEIRLGRKQIKFLCKCLGWRDSHCEIHTEIHTEETTAIPLPAVN